MPKEIIVNNVIHIFTFLLAHEYAYYYFKTKCCNATMVPQIFLKP